MTFPFDLDAWKILLIAYFLTGAMIILTTKARKEVFGVATVKERATNPAWKIAVLYLITVFVAILFWPTFLPSWFGKKETLLNEFNKTVGKTELKELYEAMATLSAQGCDTDEIPGATGEFGYIVSNPIPTKTTFGSTSYLARLQTATGEKVQYERIGSFASPISDWPIDGYRLADTEGTEIGVIYLSPYHQRNSEKSPRGLSLLL